MCADCGGVVSDRIEACRILVASCAAVWLRIEWIGRHDWKRRGRKESNPPDGLCEASSEASEPGEGGGLRRSKRSKSGGDERAHGAAWRGIA